MKNSILFLSLSLMFILSSCEQSKKGAWTESDIEKCKKEILDGMKEKKEEFEMMKSMFKIDENEFSKCLFSHNIIEILPCYFLTILRGSFQHFGEFIIAHGFP